MHPLQAQLLNRASALLEKTAAKKPAAPPKAPVLWKYTDPDGNVFYLEEKKTTVRSPFNGKSFTAKPVKHTPSQVGQDLKEEIQEGKKTKKAAGEDPWKV